MPSQSPNLALSAHRIHASVHAQPILRDLSVDFTQGRWTSIVGPNGAGKSSLLKVLSGLWPAHSLQGQVALQGRPLHSWPRRQRAQTLASRSTAWLATGSRSLTAQPQRGFRHVALFAAFLQALKGRRSRGSTPAQCVGQTHSA